MYIACVRSTSTVWLLVVALNVAPHASGEPTGPSSAPAAATVLRMAISEDGLKFEDSGSVFVHHASAPDLVRLDNKEIVAVFDYAGGQQTGDELIAVSRSADDGRSWSPVQPIRIRGRNGRSIRAQHGDLVPIGNGHYRLFFTTTTKPDATRNDRAGAFTLVRAAVTRDCVEYRLDESVVVKMQGDGDIHPTSARIDDELHLYGASLEHADVGIARYTVSQSGGRFAPSKRIRIPDVSFVGSLVSFGRSVRAYVGGAGGVRSLVSRDGRRWKLEDGVRIDNAWDPAVIRLRDGSFLMMYCTWLDEGLLATPQIASVAEFEAIDVHEYDSIDDQLASGTALVDADSPTGEYAPEDASIGEWTTDRDEGIVLDAGDSLSEQGSEHKGPDTGDETSDTQATSQDFAQSIEPGTAGDVEESEWSVKSAGGRTDSPHDQPSDTWVNDDAPDHDAVVTNLTPPSGTDARAGAETSSAGVDADPEASRAASDQEATGRVGTSADAIDTGEERPDSDYEDESTIADEVQWATSGPDDWADQDALAFVPPPDFDKKLDYMEWYRTRALDQPEDNAYDAYAAFMPGLRDASDVQAEWPELNDMFNDREYEGEPVPWDPADHPEWESSNDQVQDLLERFRDATTHEGYAAPPIASKTQTDGQFADQDLMLRIMLPQLSSHRRLQRATLADAWRLRDGELSVEHMFDAWRTALRGANHLARGATLIEELVAMAERGLVQLNARWALRQIAFSADQLETAIDLLARYDEGYRDRRLAVVGEHAASMDTLQWVFMPARPGGPPRFNMRRARSLFEWGMEPGTELEGPLKALAEMGPDDVQKTIDATEGYYRELARLVQIGYPMVRAADVAAAQQKCAHTNAWTELMFPDLSRVHLLRARDEASRRATQLAFAVHLFKLREGRWPGTLDELRTSNLSATRGSSGAHDAGATGPGAPGSASAYDTGATDGSSATGATSGLPASAYLARITTDPFTGKDFGYRLGDDGPTIYSLSENGLDNGGVHSPRWDDEITNDQGSDDHVFWPPQQRPPRK